MYFGVVLAVDDDDFVGVHSVLKFVVGDLVQCW